MIPTPMIKKGPLIITFARSKGFQYFFNKAMLALSFSLKVVNFQYGIVLCVVESVIDKVWVNEIIRHY